MSLRSGIIKQDPELPPDKLLNLPPPRPKNAIFEDKEKSKVRPQSDAPSHHQIIHSGQINKNSNLSARCCPACWTALTPRTSKPPTNSSRRWCKRYSCAALPFSPCSLVTCQRRAQPNRDVNEETRRAASREIVCHWKSDSAGSSSLALVRSSFRPLCFSLTATSGLWLLAPLQDQKREEKVSKRVNAIQEVNESVSLLTQLLQDYDGAATNQSNAELLQVRRDSDSGRIDRIQHHVGKVFKWKKKTTLEAAQ